MSGSLTIWMLLHHVMYAYVNATDMKAPGSIYNLRYDMAYRSPQVISEFMAHSISECALSCISHGYCQSISWSPSSSEGWITCRLHWSHASDLDLVASTGEGYAGKYKSQVVYLLGTNR